MFSESDAHARTHLSKVDDPLCSLPYGQALLLSLGAGVAERSADGITLCLDIEHQRRRFSVHFAL